MRRLIQAQLEEWFHSPHRKPLVLKGARQVGKTFAVNEFGKTFIEGQNRGKYHYLDLKKERDLHSIFQDTQDIKKIIEFIELKKRTKILPGKDLIFFEIKAKIDFTHASFVNSFIYLITSSDFVTFLIMCVTEFGG